MNGSRIGLTPLEFGLFAYLVARPNRAVARYELVEAVWGYGKEASTSNVVETVVRSPPGGAGSAPKRAGDGAGSWLPISADNLNLHFPRGVNGDSGASLKNQVERSFHGHPCALESRLLQDFKQFSSAGLCSQ